MLPKASCIVQVLFTSASRISLNGKAPAIYADFVVHGGCQFTKHFFSCDRGKQQIPFLTGYNQGIATVPAILIQT